MQNPVKFIYALFLITLVGSGLAFLLQGKINSYVNEQGVIVSQQSNPEVKKEVIPTIPDKKVEPVSSVSVLQNLFQEYKNGEISECVMNGKTYYSAGINAYDGGGATYDSDGKKVGEYQGMTGQYTGIKPQNCEKIYVVEKNIWGFPAVNKYNLK